jgi:hypothetical protein
MGRIDYFRRVQAALITMFANSELRWFEEMDEARNGTLSASKLFLDANAMANDAFSVARNALELGGSPILPHVHFERRAADTVAVQTELGYLHEPVSEDEVIAMTEVAHIGPGGAVGPPGLAGCVAFENRVGLPPGVDRETIKVHVIADAAGVPAVGYYTAVVLRGPAPWPLPRGVGTAIATVSVHLS